MPSTEGVAPAVSGVAGVVGVLFVESVEVELVTHLGVEKLVPSGKCSVYTIKYRYSPESVIPQKTGGAYSNEGVALPVSDAAGVVGVLGDA